MAEVKVYSRFVQKALNKEILLPGDAFKLMLTTSTYVPNQDTDDYKDDVTGEIAAGGGYTTGGEALSGVSLTYFGQANEWRLFANPVVWAGSTITAARYAVLYDDTPVGDSAKPLICYVDFGTEQSSIANIFDVTWGDTGILSLNVSS